MPHQSQNVLEHMIDGVNGGSSRGNANGHAYQDRAEGLQTKSVLQLNKEASFHGYIRDFFCAQHPRIASIERAFGQSPSKPCLGHHEQPLYPLASNNARSLDTSEKPLTRFYNTRAPLFRPCFFVVAPQTHSLVPPTCVNTLSASSPLSSPMRSHASIAEGRTRLFCCVRMSLATSRMIYFCEVVRASRSPDVARTP